MTKMNQKLWIGLVIALIVITLLSLHTCKQSQNISEKDGLMTSLNDTLKLWKDKTGQEHASIGVITTQNPDDFLDIPSKDPEIQRLQEKVRKYKKQIKDRGSVTQVNTETKVVYVKVPTEVQENPSVPNSPTYSSNFNLNDWVKGSVIASRDSTIIRNLSVKNKFTVVLGQEKTGFLGLGKPRPFVEVTDKNPYTQTKSLRTYQVDDTRKGSHWNLGIYGGYGATLTKGIIATGPQLGVGVTYNLRK